MRATGHVHDKQLFDRRVASPVIDGKQFKAKRVKQIALYLDIRAIILAFFDDKMIRVEVKAEIRVRVCCGAKILPKTSDVSNVDCAIGKGANGWRKVKRSLQVKELPLKERVDQMRRGYRAVKG